MPAKSGDRVTPPHKPGGWDVRHTSNQEAKGWEELCQVARTNMWETWVILTDQPTSPQNPKRQHRLKGKFATREIHGRKLDQWQYEVTSGGRIWYCPDHERRIVWVTFASQSHPSATN